MASLTIRKLDERAEEVLRLRAARNGRSVEDEVRVILREASEDRPRRRRASERFGPPSRRRADGSAASDRQPRASP